MDTYDTEYEGGIEYGENTEYEGGIEYGDNSDSDIESVVEGGCDCHSKHGGGMIDDFREARYAGRKWFQAFLDFILIAAILCAVILIFIPNPSNNARYGIGGLLLTALFCNLLWEWSQRAFTDWNISRHADFQTKNPDLVAAAQYRKANGMSYRSLGKQKTLIDVPRAREIFNTLRTTRSGEDPAGLIDEANGIYNAETQSEGRYKWDPTTYDPKTLSHLNVQRGNRLAPNPNERARGVAGFY
jgi:hypothetical protein